ncbi:MAG: DUF2752 domain-containing protein [Lentisphaeria bacterium]|nr:DUF2752 domain-containing protein [Lentisphaeria bacterium]
MTRAFCSISRLNIKQAIAYNKFSVFTYISFALLNIFSLFLIYYLLKKRILYHE